MENGVRILAEGLKFPEGPVAMPDGSIVLVEIERETISRVDPDGTVSVLAQVGGGPNGLALDRTARSMSATTAVFCSAPSRG